MTHIWAPEQHWPHNICGKFQNNRQGGAQYGKSSKGGHVYKSEQSYVKQEHWEVQPATPLG